MERDFMGRGWKFPVSVNPVTGKIEMVEHEDDIREAVRIILSTSLGERVMNVDFGCGISKFAFETTDMSTITLIEHRVKEALEKWEKRITDITVDSDMDPEGSGTLFVNVKYIVRATNMPGNLVYPFYINEGT